MFYCSQIQDIAMRSDSRHTTETYQMLSSDNPDVMRAIISHSVSGLDVPFKRTDFH